MEVMEEVSLSAELRENASVLASQLLDSQALLQTLAAKSSLISQLQFERDQFLTQQQRLQAAAQLIPTQLSRISGELQTAKTQLETETLLNQRLQVTASALTASPAAGQKELKRLRKLRAAKETAIVRLKEEIHSCRNDTGVRLIIEPPSHSQDSLDTELHSVREGNRALRQQIARLERKMVSIGAKIDRLRRLQSVHKQVKPLETPMTPLSQRDTAAPSSPLLDRKVVVEPNSVPSDVLALFRMPQSRKPTRLGKYSASQDMKDAYYLPIPLEFPSSPQFLAFKSELHLMLSLYQSDAECPKEHVDIVATSFEKVQEKEAAVDFLVTALSGVCKSMSAPDARFFLVSVLKMTQSKEVMWSIAKYAVSDFYRNRKWEGGKHQWCSESNGVSTLQEMWVEVTVTSLTRCNEVVLLRKLVKLLCVHHNTPLLHYLHSTHQSLPGLTCLPLLTTLDSHTDEALSGVLITSPWSLEDRIWTLKCVTALRGTAFINFFLTHHMAPIFTSTLPGTEARLFYFHCISLALKSMKGESSWSSTRAHLIQVLQVISPSLHYQGQSVFTAAETATAAAILAKI